MALDTLVDAATLAAHLGDPQWVIVDCRHDLVQPEQGRAEYFQGHIPGAHFAHLDHDLASAKNGRNGRHPLPEPAALADRLGRAGLQRGKQLVAYDAQGGMYAARLWWLARWLGHHDVAVLDGGWQAWMAQGRPVSTEVPPEQATRFEANVVQDAPVGSVAVDHQFLLERLNRTALIDARAPDRFRGENETLDPVGGRIPGARNRFFRDNLGADGRFKPAGELRAEFASVLAGAPPGEVVHSCGSGVSACHNLLAMEIAGLTGSRLYPGSWSEWCADPARPVAKGPA